MVECQFEEDVCHDAREAIAATSAQVRSRLPYPLLIAACARLDLQNEEVGCE